MIIPEIQINETQLNSVLALLGFKGTKRIIRRSLNKIAVSARQEISVGVRADMPIKAGDLKRRSLKITQAKDASLVATINIFGSRIPLKDFNARQKKRGVSYTVQKGRRQTLDSAFIVKSMGDHVFKRVAGPRVPIIKLFGPSVPHVFENLSEFAEGVYNQKLSSKLAKEIDTQLQLELERRG